MEEQLDILNEQGEKTGEIRTKKDAHLLGLIHKTVHVWIINSKRQLLLQKRSENMEAYPGFWYNSASGHVSAGQSSLEATQRETFEELGISFSQTDFKYLFTIRKREILNQGKYINNEFNDVYLVSLDFDMSKLKLQASEVDETMWIDIEEFKKWISVEGKILVPEKEEHDKLLEYLSK